MTVDVSRASRLALLAAGADLLLGGAALWLGLAEGAIALWGFGAACLLLGLPSLGVWQRIQEGFGNRGLERERLTLRAVSHLLRLLALGVALTSVAALMGDRAPLASFSALGVAILAAGLITPIWLAKRAWAGLHPSLELDAARTRTLLELAVLVLVGGSWAAGSPGPTPPPDWPWPCACS